MKPVCRLALSLLLLPFAAAFSASPSFDCSRAAGEIERLICSDSGLSALDRRMQKVYARALQELPAVERQAQQAAQRNWLEGRDDCRHERRKKACTARWYKRRLAELQVISGQLVVPEPVLYRCDAAGEDRLTAYYYEDAAMPVAVFNRLGRGLDQQDMAYRTLWNGKPAYVGRHAILHGAGAGLEGSWDEEPLRCRRLPAVKRGEE